MISWWWVPIGAIAGGILGFFVTAIIIWLRSD